MKHLAIALLLALCVCAPAHADTKAQQIEFLLSQVRTTSGPLSGGKVYFYAAGTTTPKTVWLDRDKSNIAANPYTLDSNGTAQLYAEGIYKVVIKNSAGVTVYSRDNLAFIAFSATDTANSQTVGGFFPDTGTTGSTVPVRDGNGKLPGDILGNSATVTSGVYTSGNQTIAGSKTFSSPIVGSITGNAATATTAVDSDKVDGMHASQSPAGGQVVALSPTGTLVLPGNISSPALRADASAKTVTVGRLSGVAGDTDVFSVVNRTGVAVFQVDTGNATVTGPSGATLWHSGNTGAGTASTTHIDADTVDGKHASAFPYTASETGLRIVRGSVAANGTVLGGSGFSVSKTGTGQYTITFSNAFSAAYSFVPSCRAASVTGEDVNLSYMVNGLSTVFVGTGYHAGANAVTSADKPFDFIVIGPN